MAMVGVSCCRTSAHGYLHSCPAGCFGVSCCCQVLGRMKQAMVEHSSSASHSFLLDDDSTLPFVANEILAQMDDKV